MSNEKVLMNKDDLVSLANSIRAKSGSTDGMTVSQMKIAVDEIPTIVTRDWRFVSVGTPCEISIEAHLGGE